jgi:hypothetical protein
MFLEEALAMSASHRGYTNIANGHTAETALAPLSGAGMIL